MISRAFVCFFVGSVVGLAGCDSSRQIRGPSTTPQRPADAGSTDVLADDGSAGPDADSPAALDASSVFADADAPDATALDATAPRDGGSPSGSDPFTARQLTPTITGAICAYQERCTPAVTAYYALSRVDCMRDLGGVVEPSYEAFEGAIAIGRMTFSRAAFDACLAGMRTADCALGIDDFYCLGAFTGLQPRNAPCAHPNECGAADYCASSLNQCGDCVARATVGQPCANRSCVDGARCDDTSGSAVCVAEVGESAACGAGVGICRGSLQCVNGQCVRPLPAGAACTPNPTSTPDCDTNANVFCTGTTCQRITWSPPGGTCGPTAGCDANGTCNRTTRTCEARPTSGDPCSASVRCAHRFFCRDGGCLPQGSAGSACTDASECEPGLLCGRGVCTRLQWQECN